MYRMQNRAKKQNYKEMLDYQLQVRDKFKMAGNMSSNEKAINRYDLEAYKNYDSRHFSLVPGIQHQKYNSVNQYE